MGGILLNSLCEGEDGFVSVIIPLYNKERYVLRSIASVLGQTYGNFELIVVDDGSTDNGALLVSGISDVRLSMVRQENAGPGAARNRGAVVARYGLLAFLDADDEWFPDFLERAVNNFLTSDGKALSVLGHEKVGSARQCCLPEDCLSGQRGDFSLPGNFPPNKTKQVIDYCHSGALICSRALFIKYGGFYEKNHCLYGEDSYLWLQFVFNNRIYIDRAPGMRFHTEVSELSNRRYFPVAPLIYDNGPILGLCAAGRRGQLLEYIGYYYGVTVDRLFRESGLARTIRLQFHPPFAALAFQHPRVLGCKVLAFLCQRVTWLLRSGFNLLLRR